jgi:K+-transporting ATPase ATPase C chain
MQKHFKPALLLLLIWTLVAGVAYPLAVTGLAQLLFPSQANGSLLLDGSGQPQGARLIGQAFADPGHFWSRPSATLPYPYNAANSAGSNLGPANPALLEAARSRIQSLQAADPGNTHPIPVDLATASASGLDPHISPAAAEYQVHRIAQARHIDAAKLRALIAQHTEPRQWGLLGEPRVNVLGLNLALDGKAR